MRIRQVFIKAAAVGFSSMLLLTAACGNKSTTRNLMTSDSRTDKVEGSEFDQSAINQTADFSVKLFTQTQAGEKNMMISPVSILAVLSMAETGAKGETLRQMKAAIGLEKDAAEQAAMMNEWLVKVQKESANTFSFANSIWIRNDDSDFTVNPEFLKTNKKNSNAAVYSSDFKQDTVDAINRWVSKNTNGMIKKMVDKINENTMMHLINAVTFEDEWMDQYEKEDISPGTFYALNGSSSDADYLCSTEGRYLKDDQAVGVMKPYKNGCSFVALLPNEGVSLKEYIDGMSGSHLLELVKNAEKTDVETMIPKFKSEYAMEARELLLGLGITDAFDEEKADFSGIGKINGGNLFISDVLHKTYIEVDEKGTKASAVTDGILKGTSAAEPKVPVKVELTRPFVYAIIDNATSLPIFMGTVTDI